MNRRNFISMLGLSALVAKVFPVVAKKVPAAMYYKGHFSHSGMIFARREFQGWGNVVTVVHKWDNKQVYLLSPDGIFPVNQEPKQT